MQVVRVHRWPFNPSDVEDEMARFDLEPHHRDSMTELHQNAWIVVVEQKGPADLGVIDEVTYAPSPREVAAVDSRQTPWFEQVLEDSADRSQIAFFLHYMNPEGKLFYGEEVLRTPTPTELPGALRSVMQYECP